MCPWCWNIAPTASIIKMTSEWNIDFDKFWNLELMRQS